MIRTECGGGIERRGAKDDVYIKEALGSLLYAEINLLTKG
jgi:hypothetical protein